MASIKNMNDIQNKQIDNSDSQKLIRVICTIIIAFVHLGTVIKDVNSPLLIFTEIGYLCVGAFFFFTGYNLISSFKKDYSIKKGFIINKIKKIYIPASIANILFGLIVIGYKGIGQLIKWALLIECANSTIWYIQSVLYIYLVFYILFSILSKLIKKVNASNKTKYLLIILFSIILMSFYFLFKRGDIQNNSKPISLFVGMMFALLNEKALLKFLKIKWILGLLFLVLSYIFHRLTMQGTILHSFIGWNLMDFLYQYFSSFRYFDLLASYIIVWNIFEYLAPLFFVLGLYFLFYNIEYKSKVIDFISNISLEIYILHFFFMILFKWIVVIENDILFVLIYIISLIIGAYLLKKIKDIISTQIDKISIKKRH